MTQYIGIIHKDPASDHGVSFPDFPGCITAGSDLDEARRMANEALSGHIECMIEAGHAIPEPLSFETIMQDADFRDGLAILVTASALASQSIS